MRSVERNGWILGLVLIALGGLFLLRNAGVPVPVGNWWALFILIPAIGAFLNARELYLQNGQVTLGVVALITGGLLPLTIALIFLFEADFGALWPVLMVMIGTGILLRSGATDITDKSAEVPS